MVTFGGRAVRTHALSLMQHLQCLGIASLTLIIGFLIKFIPIDTLRLWQNRIRMERVAQGQKADLDTHQEEE